MAPLLELANLEPLVLRNIVDLSLAARIVRVLGANSINVIFGLEVVAAVEMRQLMPTLAVLHGCTSFNLVCLFVQNKAIICNYGTDFILFQFTADQEDFVLSLNASKAFRDQLSVANSD